MADTPPSPRPAKATRYAPRRAAGTTKTAKATGAAAGRSRATPRTAATRTSAARRGAATGAPRGATDRVGDYAERAVLIPVGAALLARERVATSVGDVLATCSSPTKTRAQLRSFERRGGTARTRLEREVRKTRTRVERELRERRRELERQRERLTKSLSDQVEQTQGRIERAGSQIEDALRARLDDSADLASRLQERVLRLV
jgi:hypothetical protein